MDPVATFLEEQRRSGSWPGAVWAVVEKGRTVTSGAVGSRSLVPEELPARVDTIYDLASLTKPLATAGLLALLAQEGKLDLEAPAASLLPGLACSRGGRPTFMDLALHRAGLPAWRPFYQFAKTPDQVLNRIMQLEPEVPCGTTVRYSDPGYILLGEALRRVSGKDLDVLFDERIRSPLGLQTMGFRPPAQWRPRIAPTELGNRYERALAESLGAGRDADRLESEEGGELHSPGPSSDFDLSRSKQASVREEEDRSAHTGLHEGPADRSVPGATPRSQRRPEGQLAPGPVPRDGLIQGEVHDGNAFALGGVAGHAGLFGDVADVVRLAEEFLGAGQGLFGARALELFRANGTPGLEQGRTLGWKRAIAGAREAEGVLSPESFGHNGFTGTSVWIDPVAERTYVLLTNRVHPDVQPIDMNLLRRRFHEVASHAA